MPEWSNGAVSKTVDRASGPWVRIPPSPPESNEVVDGSRSARFLEEIPKSVGLPEDPLDDLRVDRLELAVPRPTVEVRPVLEILDR